MSRFIRVAALVAGAVLLAAAQGAAHGATADDIARFVAGMQPSSQSPLVPLTQHPSWQRHARWFDTNWASLERERLSKVRAWSVRHLKDRTHPLLYLFSGPDFLYAAAFYPSASTYVLGGLEPVGAIPDVTARTIPALPRIQQSIGSSLRFSFFITRQMREHLTGGELAGTLPILYAYIARSGMTIRDVALVNLDRNGELHPAKGEARGMTPGVKIVLSHGNAPPQTLYYFRTDLSNPGVNSSGFLKFAATFADAHSLLKSASYLMHSGNFTQVRDFVLKHSRTVVQDDSGIPLAAFSPDTWDLQPFGTYLGPIAIFPGRHQPRLGELFRKGKAPPLDFGIGYRHRGHDSNLLLAVRKQPKADPATSSVPRPPREIADGNLPPLPPGTPLPPLQGKSPAQSKPPVQGKPPLRGQLPANQEE